MTDYKKPTIIEMSKWQKEYYSIRMPTETKEDFIKKKLKEWYRNQWYLKNNK